MGKIYRNGLKFGDSSPVAVSVKYNNADSGLNALSVQGAIDEIDSTVNEIDSTVNEIDSTVSRLGSTVNGLSGLVDELGLSKANYKHVSTTQTNPLNLIKEEYENLERESNTIVYANTPSDDNNYSLIVQKANDRCGSAIAFGCSINPMKYYTLLDGVWIENYPTQTRIFDANVKQHGTYTNTLLRGARYITALISFNNQWDLACICYGRYALNTYGVTSAGVEYDRNNGAVKFKYTNAEDSATLYKIIAHY